MELNGKVDGIINGKVIGNIPYGYKKTIVGIIPIDWEVKKFKDITDILKCGIASTPTYVKKGIPFLSSQNVKENKLILNKYNFVSEEFHKKLTKKDKPRKGDILYTRVGSNFGKATVVDIDWEFSIYVSLTLIRMKQGYHNLYYSYLLNSDKYIYNARKTVFQGGGVQNLNVSEVEKFDMIVPPYNEQVKIASILSKWDNAIELKEKLIAKKKEQKKGLMRKLLTGELRFPGFDGNWKEFTLGEIGNTYNGLSGKSAVDFGEGKPYIPYKSIFEDSKIDISKVGFVRIDQDEKQNKAQKGDIFFTTSSETPDEVGMCSVLLDDIDELYLNSFCFGYRLNNFKILLPSFAQFYFRSNEFRRKVQVLAQGSTRFNISKNEVMKIMIKIPEIEEQEQISKVLSNSDNEIHLLKNQVRSLKEQKQALMQQLLTGKIRVKV